MNIGMWIIIIIGGAVGILSCLYCVLSLPVVIGWKVYRLVRYKIGMFY